MENAMEMKRREAGGLGYLFKREFLVYTD